jgi:molecular chaperone GrpE
MPDGIKDDQAPVSAAQPPDTAALEAENESLRDRLMRALADDENTRRRAERSAHEARQFANFDFARELLAVADNLQRAVAAAEQRASGNPADAPLIEGLRAAQSMLDSVLERFGIRKIDALGAPFDPGLHEAMMEVDDASHEPGSVAHVMEDEYTIHDRLLRHARVAVAARRPSSRPPPDGPEFQVAKDYVANDHP